MTRVTPVLKPDMYRWFYVANTGQNWVCFDELQSLFPNIPKDQPIHIHISDRKRKGFKPITFWKGLNGCIFLKGTTKYLFSYAADLIEPLRHNRTTFILYVKVETVS